MTESDSVGEPPEPGLGHHDAQKLARLTYGPRLLARATRALTGVPADADDATLLALLGPVIVPTLGDVLALYTVGADGDVSLAGAAPAQSRLAQERYGYLEQYPGAAARYGAIAAQGRAAIVRAPTPNAPVGEAAGSPGAESASGVPGLALEIVAPLGSGAGHDALLTIGSLDRARQYEDADLAAVEVLAALVEARRTVRELTRRETRLRQQNEDAALAGRELAHRLNNDLTMPVGVVELLLDRGPLGPDLQEMLVAASKDLAALEQHIRAFHDLMRSQSTAPAGSRPPER